MQYYQTIKAYECISGKRTNYNNHLVKGNVEVIRTIYDNNGKVVQINSRVFKDKDELRKTTNKEPKPQST